MLENGLGGLLCWNGCNCKQCRWEQQKWQKTEAFCDFLVSPEYLGTIVWFAFFRKLLGCRFLEKSKRFLITWLKHLWAIFTQKKSFVFKSHFLTTPFIAFIIHFEWDFIVHKPSLLSACWCRRMQCSQEVACVHSFVPASFIQSHTWHGISVGPDSVSSQTLTEKYGVTMRRWFLVRKTVSKMRTQTHCYVVYLTFVDFFPPNITTHQEKCHKILCLTGHALSFLRWFLVNKRWFYFPPTGFIPYFSFSSFFLWPRSVFFYPRRFPPKLKKDTLFPVP